MKPLRPSLLVFVCLLLSFLAGAEAQQSGDFTIILMPDVQNESQYYPAVLAAETAWIKNQQQTRNIQAVLGLGDIVNDGSNNTQWINADAAYQVLDQAGIPYFLSIGNHDYDNVTPSARSTVGFNQWFGPSRYLGKPWYLGNYNGGNEDFYGVLNINGTNYLFLVLEFVPRDAAVSWASSILAANQDKEAIIITHSYLYSDGTRVDQCDTMDQNSDNYGDKLWAKLVGQYGNISTVVNGHLTSAYAARRADVGVKGNLVNQMFSNYQTMPNGGNGYLRILTFHPGANTIDVDTYSPYLNQHLTDSANNFTIPWHMTASNATTGTISGLVRDVATCKTIPGVQVTVGSNTVSADSKGHYVLSLPGGTYSASASATNYASATQSVLVNNGFDADNDYFLLSTAPPPCTLSTTSPSVTICTPANSATTPSPVTVTAGSTDSNPVNTIQLYVDGISVVTQKGATLNTSATLTNGSHRLTVQAKDSANTTFKQTINITVGTAATAPCTLNPASPTVTICSPLNGATVTSPLQVSAGTTDFNTVSQIQLYVDGKGVVTQSGGVLNYTATLTPGSHRLTVQAKDSTGTIFKQTISVIAN